jgi:CheY-like chemotaxis protein
MATGQGDMKQEKKAIDAGVDGFIAKPFNADELEKKIESVFNSEAEQPADLEAARKPRKSESGKVNLRVAHIQITDHLVLGVLKHMIQERSADALAILNWRPSACPAGTMSRKPWPKGTLTPPAFSPPSPWIFSISGSPSSSFCWSTKVAASAFEAHRAITKNPSRIFSEKRPSLIPHKMSVHHMLAHMFFSRIGIKPGMAGEKGIDLNFEIVAPIKMPEFLRSNPDACGFMVAEPLGTKAIASGIASLQFLSGQMWENHPCCVLAMRDDFSKPYVRRGL